MAYTDKLQEELDFITTNPALHDQSSWLATTNGNNFTAPANSFLNPDLARIADDEALMPVELCGTAACLAGWTAIHNGYTFVASTDQDSAAQVVKNVTLPHLYKGEIFIETRSARFISRDILGLNETEASILFSSEHTLADLWAIAYALTDGEIRLPNSLPADKNGEYFIINTPEEVRELIEARLTASDVITTYITNRYLARTEHLRAEGSILLPA